MSENNANHTKPSKNGGSYRDKYDYKEIEQMLPEDFDTLFKTMPVTDETSCGLWIFKGSYLQR